LQKLTVRSYANIKGENKMATASKQDRFNEVESPTEKQPMNNGKQFTSQSDKAKEDLLGEQPIRMGQRSEDLDEEDEDFQSTSSNQTGNRKDAANSQRPSTRSH
jgi:hypothetical protein